jgi:hypothetical protein
VSLQELCKGLQLHAAPAAAETTGSTAVLLVVAGSYACPANPRLERIDAHRPEEEHFQSR